MTTDTTTEIASSAGYEAGCAAGSWVVDGNTRRSTARAILDGYEDCNSFVLDMMPAPLSGEYGGESIPELSHALGIDLNDDDNAEAYEQAFADGFWSTVCDACLAII